MRPGPIVAGVFGVFLVLLLFAPFVFTVTYHQNATMSVKWLFFRKVLFPAREKKPGKAKEKKSRKPKAEQKEKKTFEMPDDFWEFLTLIKNFLEKFAKIFGKTLKKIKVYDCNFQAAVAADDAASAAISSGTLNAAVYSAFAVVGSFVTLRTPVVTILPDVGRSDTEIVFYTKVSLRLVNMLAMAIKLVPAVFSLVMGGMKKHDNKNKDGAQNER